MRRASTLLVCAFLLACSDLAPAASTPAATDPAPVPSGPVVDLNQRLTRVTPALPAQLAISIAPGARAWEMRHDEWVVEATVVLHNGGSAPMDVDPRLLRVRDQAHVLHANARSSSSMERTRVGPGGSLRIELRAAPIVPGDRGKPTEVRVDYGYAGAMSPTVSSPVTPVSTEGLVARFSDAGAPERVGRPAVGSRPPQFAWRVRLRIELENTTDHLVRRPFGHISATRESGAPCYWGDGAGVGMDREWFEPGGHASGQLTLMFPDSQAPPRRITLRYASGAAQTLPLPSEEMGVPPTR